MLEEPRISPAAIGALAKGDIPNAIIASIPGGIEMQEAEGQKDMIATNILPKEGLDRYKKNLVDLGFIFHDDHDDLFINCTFPDGWKKVATDHSLWSELKDDKDRVRGGIFYKAAFYDRSAHMRLSPRFRITTEPEDAYKTEISYEERKNMPEYGRVYDGEIVVFETEAIAALEDEKSYDVRDRYLRQCEQWLMDKGFTDYKNPLAYWDE